ncbi:DNA internalization-related competence protein ComEC/Rec2 [Gilvimarinus xylanilyticus]|uniref:DNA internalization-related competence protein ComEC/Rec2 n=1 Tax=Gilvimarinus xylanilyticus TaxID=2944139 RepID=A0A9X2HUN7_9GAMM|nr:DNA internalization-related competence protein ComEC/Rec2 [Gilvimarinus xylanilyticus]MCP8898788.1 DNA internalization-related competence protein ComEC/Rec2 [Gilvimarinus xylanilyticus]
MMLYWLAAVIAGLILPGFLPFLLPWWVCALLLAVGFVLGAVLARFERKDWAKRLVLLMLVFSAAVSWSNWYGHKLVDNLLPDALVGKDILVQGQIWNQPEVNQRRVRFLLAPTASADLPRLIQLSWYRSPAWAGALEPGDRLELVVRLKPPRSFINPEGFDYRLWQLRRGVGATGYVRDRGQNQLLAQAQAGQNEGVRNKLRGWLRAQQPVNLAVLQALLLGDRTLISDTQWQLFRATGTTHLMAISGLHIGLAAAWGYLLGLVLGRVLVLWLPVPAVVFAMALGAAAAWGYAALAGFALPTQRALAMLLMFYVARLSGLRIGGAQVLMLAAAAVLLLDPLSIYDPGFWLSFVAVAALVLAFSGLVSASSRGRLQVLWRPQWVAFIALLVPLGLFFDQWSLVSPLANIIAIALVSVWVVPALFTAALLGYVWLPAAGVFLWLADTGLSVLGWWLNGLQRLATATGFPAVWDTRLTPAGALLLALACALLLLPASLRLRPQAFVLLIALWLLPRPQPALLQVSVMDVGQGLAVVIYAGDKTLVYDTGPWFGDSFNAGADIVAPYVLASGREKIDALVVSHSHSDHAGGAPGLLEALPVDRFYAGEALEYLREADEQRLVSCHLAKPWQWQDYRFRFIPGVAGSEGNNASCVLVIEWRGVRLLLPGDIERARERTLARQLAPVDFLLVPHHGSKSSSSAALLSSIRPDLAVVSSGYRNRHGHPHQQVVERYRGVGSRVYNTAQHGAVQILFDGERAPQIITWRQRTRRYWRD